MGDQFVDKQQRLIPGLVFPHCRLQQERNPMPWHMLQQEGFPRSSARCVLGAMKGVCKNECRTTTLWCVVQSAAEQPYCRLYSAGVHRSEWTESEASFMWTTRSVSNTFSVGFITCLLKTENTVCIQDNFRTWFADRHEEAPQQGIMSACSGNNRVRSWKICLRSNTLWKKQNKKRVSGRHTCTMEVFVWCKSTCVFVSMFFIQMIHLHLSSKCCFPSRSYLDIVSGLFSWVFTSVNF